jgi:hypothetical protein
MRLKFGRGGGICNVYVRGYRIWTTEVARELAKLGKIVSRSDTVVSYRAVS